MSDYGRRIVVDSGFETAVGDLSRAIREEGLRVIARVDVREHFRRELGRDFRQYFMLEAWSPELAREALKQNLDVGAVLPTGFSVYELADGETAVVAREPLSPLAEDPAWRRSSPLLATIVDRETTRVARVFSRLQAHAQENSDGSVASTGRSGVHDGVFESSFLCARR